MEITQVTKAFLWLETQDYTHAFDLNGLYEHDTKGADIFATQAIEVGAMTGNSQCYIHVCAGHTGNDRADSLDGLDAISDGLPMDHAGIINKFRNIGGS